MNLEKQTYLPASKYTLTSLYKNYIRDFFFFVLLEIAPQASGLKIHLTNIDNLVYCLSVLS